MSAVLENLNEKQKNSVLSENKRVLVLAGAGSGKTKTVISKLLHLIGEKNVKPSSILAITFTKNATNEMIDRLIISSDSSGTYESMIQDKRIKVEIKDAERRKRTQEIPWLSRLTVKTFHALCYDILRKNGNPVFDNQFKLISDQGSEDLEVDKKILIETEKPSAIMQKILTLACKDKAYILKLKRYILDYYVDRIFVENEIQRTNHPNQRTYTTLKGETVKSKSERDIADWLYRHSIQYSYERKVLLKDFNFRPDFHIPSANLYIEHVSDKSYSMSDKEKQFTQAGIHYVTTNESIMNNSSVFNLTMEKIVMGRITESISEEVTLNYLEEFKSYHDKIEDFLKTVRRLMTMMKAEDASDQHLLDKSSKSDHERVRVFYELAIPLINSYKDYCKNRSYLDFDDLIILAIKLLKENEDTRIRYQNQFKNIMVDEFQDVNSLQVVLLDLLLTEETQLFCVGDDWQSIYGFRGSNVDYIVNFASHYKNAEVHKLDINYRSNQSIVGASNEVIKNNKNQISKDVKAFKKSLTKIQIYRAKRADIDGVEFVTEKVRELYSRGYGKDDILVLYRRTKMFNPYFESLKNERLFVSYKTIHASKGLEAKAVFIIGLTEGSGGFPDVWLDDAIFRVVKDVKYDMLLEEERRLFYVAITRAKDELFLVTELGNESPFVDEIPQIFYAKNQTEFAKIFNPVRICTKCNHPLGSEKNFCGECGNPLSLN